MAASVFGDIPFTEAATEAWTTPALDAPGGCLRRRSGPPRRRHRGPGQRRGVGPRRGGHELRRRPARWTAVAHTLKARFHLHWAEANGDAEYQAASGRGRAGHRLARRQLEGHPQHRGHRAEPLVPVHAGPLGLHLGSGDYLLPLMDGGRRPALSRSTSATASGAYVARDSALSPTGYGAADFDFPIVSCAENAFIIGGGRVQRRRRGRRAMAAAQDGARVSGGRGRRRSLRRRRPPSTRPHGQRAARRDHDQKYTALFLNMEVWNDYKRTCRPAITERAGGMPGRLYYGQAERQSNPNIPDAGAAAHTQRQRPQPLLTACQEAGPTGRSTCGWAGRPRSWRSP